MDLNPDGATESFATGVHDGKQVGYAVIDGMHRASLWSGSAESWVDLTPEGATYSEINGIHSGWQVGYAIIDGVGRFGIWNGTAGSWEVLPLPEPETWIYSASSIWRDATNIFVGGSWLPEVEHADGAITVQVALLILLASWGPCDDPSDCPADFNGDGVVGVADLLIILANWG